MLVLNGLPEVGVKRPFGHIAADMNELVLIALTLNAALSLCETVSYTHLDVYKRQDQHHIGKIEFKLANVCAFDRSTEATGNCRSGKFLLSLIHI